MLLWSYVIDQDDYNVIYFDPTEIQFIQVRQDMIHLEFKNGKEKRIAIGSEAVEELLKDIQIHLRTNPRIWSKQKRRDMGIPV